MRKEEPSGLLRIRKGDIARGVAVDVTEGLPGNRVEKADPVLLRSASS